jgi:uncharacterized metal-binding protein YceD (DUF177 family)
MAEDEPPGARSPAVAPEMRRPFPVARIGDGACVDVEATPAELAALARRMGIPSIAALTCRFDLRRADGDAVHARCSLRARLQQICVVTLESFDSDLQEDFRLRFVPAGTESEEIDPEDDDEIGYDGGILDLGEAASEQLALALDPFPRKPGAELPDDQADRQAGAFAALARLLPAQPRPQKTSDD